MKLMILLHSEAASNLLKTGTIPSDLPLHPFFVHFPIVLTLFISILSLIIIIYLRKSQKENVFPLWNVIIILNLLLVFFTYFALFTGDLEHEILQHSPYLKQAIEQHETFAESFFVLTIFILAISVLGHEKFSFYKVMRIVTVIVNFVIAIPLLLFTSHLGGKIVYELDAPYFRKVIINEIKNPQGEHSQKEDHNHDQKENK